MSRFKFEGKYAMRVMKKGKGNLLAYFNVVDTELGIEFRDCRLIEGKNGVFVGAPFREYKDSNGETKYPEFWRPAFDGEARMEHGMAWVEEMAEAAYEHYQSIAKNGGGDEEEGGSRRSSNRGSSSRSSSRSSARGPAPTTGASRGASGGKASDKDLPF